MTITQHLQQHFKTQHAQITAWFAEQWQCTPPPIYASIDLRHAENKIAPIDMNLFPAGFNHLSETSLAHSIQSARTVLQQQFPDCQNILLVPENHTRNTAY